MKQVVCTAAAAAATSMAGNEQDVSMASQSATSGQREMFSIHDYRVPEWAQHLQWQPKQQIVLGLLPTPIHRWHLPNLPHGMELYIKRDDLSGMQLSGNKVRKLEFLIADAIRQQADTVITLGGIQSNHCRATAVAARFAGLNSHLVLRTSKALVDNDPGLEGNLLVERMVGARVELVSKETYTKYGSEHLGRLAEQQLQAEGLRPYLIPVGGSNTLGTWGYIEAIREIEQQLARGQAAGADKFDDIIMACGSGGTTAGAALGSFLSSIKAKVHAYSVCDSPDYFHSFIQNLLDDLGANVSSRDVVHISDVKGKGYAISTTEELQEVKEIAEATGIVLDPVYSGKAVLGLLRDLKKDSKQWEGRRVLFIHTGGLLGMYDKASQLLPLMNQAKPMQVA